MSINLYDIELMARARHQELLQDAERHRLIKEAMAGRPKKRATSPVTTIAAWLQQRFRRPAPQEPTPRVQVSC